MKVFKARKIGYCKGVEKAISQALTYLYQHKPQLVYLLNDLTHNSRAKDLLAKEGLKHFTDCVETGSLLLGPAHGLTKELKDTLKKQEFQVRELTCPIVVKLLKTSKALIDKGYHLLILGDRDHSEIKYVTSYLPENSYQVFKNPSEIGKLLPRVALVEQTTRSLYDVQQALCHLSLRSGLQELVYVNTLCQEMLLRQKEGLKLATQVDVVLVLGDRKSANTQRLFELVSEVNSAVYLVSDPQELVGIPLIDYQSVALLSGASTPDVVIKEVEDYLYEYT